MSAFRIIGLLAASISLIIFIGYRLLNPNSSQSVLDTEVEDSSSGGGQFISVVQEPGIDIHDHDHDHDHDEPITLPGTDEAYQIVRQPGSGVITSAINSNLSPEFTPVLDSIFIDVYEVARCTSPDGGTDNALYMTARPGSVELSDQFIETRRAVENWESSIPRDIGKVLFPVLSQAALDNVRTSFTSHNFDYRYTDFEVSDKRYQIHYGWILNYVAFATSEECLTATINDIYAPHTH